MAQVHHLGVRPTVQTPPGGAPVCSSVCKFEESSGRTFFDAAVNSICLQRACLSMMVLLLVVVGLIFWARILLCHSSATRSGHSLEISSSSCACLWPSAPCSLTDPTATVSMWKGDPPLWKMHTPHRSHKTRTSWSPVLGNYHGLACRNTKGCSRQGPQSGPLTCPPSMLAADNMPATLGLAPAASRSKNIIGIRICRCKNIRAKQHFGVISFLGYPFKFFSGVIYSMTLPRCRLEGVVPSGLVLIAPLIRQPCRMTRAAAPLRAGSRACCCQMRSFPGTSTTRKARRRRETSTAGEIRPLYHAPSVLATRSVAASSPTLTMLSRARTGWRQCRLDFSKQNSDTALPSPTRPCSQSLTSLQGRSTQRQPPRMLRTCSPGMLPAVSRSLVTGSKGPPLSTHWRLSCDLALSSPKVLTVVMTLARACNVGLLCGACLMFVGTSAPAAAATPYMQTTRSVGSTQVSSLPRSACRSFHSLNTTAPVSAAQPEASCC